MMKKSLEKRMEITIKIWIGENNPELCGGMSTDRHRCKYLIQREIPGPFICSFFGERLKTVNSYYFKRCEECLKEFGT